MKHVVAAVTLVVTAALLAPTAAAAGSAELTIAQLEAQGFDVKTSRIGSAPLSQCEVRSVGTAREQRRLQRFGDHLVEVVERRTIAVNLDCTR